LALLIEFRRACAGAGKVLVVQGLPQRLRDLAALYGVEELILCA
jgi:phospholipid transport system transporter-binding protein